MARVEFKSCARCGGDMVHESYAGEGDESYCIQCAYRPVKAVQEADEVVSRYARFEALRELGRLGFGRASAGK